jgi:cell division protein FtsB
MNSYRRAPAPSIRIASLCKVIISAVFIASAGISYVYLKNQLKLSGDKQIDLERQLAEVRKENEATQLQIDNLTSLAALKKRLAQNSFGLVPITTDAVVRLNQDEPNGDDLRVVSNRPFRK